MITHTRQLQYARSINNNYTKDNLKLATKHTRQIRMHTRQIRNGADRNKFAFFLTYIKCSLVTKHDIV